MTGHQFEKSQAAEKSKSERAEKSFPCFFGADLRAHQMSADCAAGQVRAHIAEFRDRDQIQNIKLSGDRSPDRSRSEVKYFGREIKKPEHIEQTEQRVSHRLQRLSVPQSREHLPAENRQQEKHHHRDFKIVRAGRTDRGKIMET